MGRMKIIIKLIILFFSCSCISQSKINGSIQDSLKNNLTSASVILKDDKGKIVSFTYSNENGNYNLSIDKIGVFYLSVNSLGYHQQSVEIIIQNQSELKNP